MSRLSSIHAPSLFTLLSLAACAAGGELEDEPRAPLQIPAETDAGAPRTGAASPPRGGSSSGGASSSSGGASSSGGSGNGSSGNGGSSSSSSSGSSQGGPVVVPDGAVVRKAEDCWDIGAGATELALGADFVLDLPSPWHPTSVLGAPPELVPGVQVGSGDPGRTRVLIPLATPIEWFLGFDRIEIEEPGGSANARSCYLDVKAPGWLHERTASWTGPGTGAVDKNVGTMKIGGGLVIEGYVFGEPDYRIEVEPSAGGVAPVRTTDFGYYGSGAYVFQPTAAGAYAFDLRMTRPPSFDVLYHVRFTVVP